MSPRKLALAALAVAVATAAACHGGQKLQGQACKQDSDCGAPASAYRCETTTGICYCRTDQGCPAAQFCNTSGFCCASSQ